MEEKGKNINLKLVKRFKDIYFYKEVAREVRNA